MPLTELALKNLKAKQTLYRVADGGGLCIEVTTKGSKLWRLRYRYNDKQQMISLGKYPDVSLARARELCKEQKAIATQGKHLTREKQAKKLRQAINGENTFAAIALRWLAIKQKGLNAKYAKQTLDRMQQHIFPIIGALPITEIKTPAVVKAIETISDRGTIDTANRMKQVVSQVFRYALRCGLCDYNPAADLRDILPRKNEEKHHACIHPSELPDLLKAMAAYRGDVLTRLAMRLLALTFVRTGELIAAKWDEIDWQKEEWNIPKERMKMKRPHMVPLSRQSLAVLKELHGITGDHAYIFFSPRSKSKHISNGVVLMALKRMGYQGKMTGHGFRALASTILNGQNYNPDWIECQLAHVESDSSRRPYNRADYLLERKKMMQDYADYLERMAIAQQNKVTKIRFAND